MDSDSDEDKYHATQESEDEEEPRLPTRWSSLSRPCHFSKFYNPSEHLAVDEVIVKFKGRVLFKQYIPKKCKCFSIKMFKLCDSTGYTIDMNVYLGKDRQRAAQHLTATHATVTNLTRGVKGFGHKLYMDNFISSPDLFDDLAQKRIYCWGL